MNKELTWAQVMGALWGALVVCDFRDFAVAGSDILASSGQFKFLEPQPG